MSFAARPVLGGFSANFVLTPGFLAGTPEYYGYQRPGSIFPFGSVTPEPMPLSDGVIVAFYHRNPPDLGVEFALITSTSLPTALSRVDVYFDGAFYRTLVRQNTTSLVFAALGTNPFAIGVPVNVQLFFY